MYFVESDPLFCETIATDSSVLMETTLTAPRLGRRRLRVLPPDQERAELLARDRELFRLYLSAKNAERMAELADQPDLVVEQRLIATEALRRLCTRPIHD
jgi:hypothetical protein